MESQELVTAVLSPGVTIEEFRDAASRLGITTDALAEHLQASRRLGESVFTGIVASGPEEPLVTRVMDDVPANFTDPRERANALLKSLLDPEQLEMYQQRDCFVVVGGETGDHYLVSTAATQGNVLCLSTGKYWCLVPRERGTPAGDQYAAQLLMIQCEERKFKYVANGLGMYRGDSLVRHIERIVGDKRLAKKLLKAAPEREEDPSIFEAAMPSSMVISQRMYDELMAAFPAWSPRSTCPCPRCEEARVEYARERGREMERMRERELQQIVNDIDAPMDARALALEQLNNGGVAREPPRRGGYYEGGQYRTYYGQNRNVTIEPIVNEDNPPPYDEPWRYHIRGELNSRTENAYQVLRERGLVVNFSTRGSVLRYEPNTFEMEIAFREFQVLDEVRHLFGV